MMIVITMSNCPLKLRGDLSRWLIEIDTGVFVGNINTRVRELVWERVCQNIKNGRATMVFGTNGEQKLDFRIHNTNWEPVDYDGITLIRRNNEYCNDAEYKKWSKAAINHRNKIKQRGESEKVYDKYAITDIETTGINEDDSIIEIAAIIVENGEITDSFSQLIACERSIPNEIVKLTGITDDMLREKGTELKDAIAMYSAFIGNMTLVGHNINFDIRFIQKAYSKYGYPIITNKLVDTMRLSRKKIDDISSYSLKSVAEYFDVDCTKRHRAYDDCVITYGIYEKLKEI